MTKASDNVFPKVLTSLNTSDQSAPSDSSWKVYAKADGIYARSSNTIRGPLGFAEIDRVEFTSPVTISASSEAAATTIVTGSALTFDGATTVDIEFYSDSIQPGSTATNVINIWLYDGSSSIGVMAQYSNPASSTYRAPCFVVRRLTPSIGVHTYSIRGDRSSGSNGTVNAGAGGTGNHMPGYIRVKRAGT